MVAVTDDLGTPCAAPSPVTTVVSLVPSLTESIAASRQSALVGVTDWCTHPRDLQVPRIRGTKNPNVAEIIRLRPDIVLANKEENRRKDVESLRAAGVAVWVTVIESVDDALRSLRRMFEQALGWPVPAWLLGAESIWSQAPPTELASVAIPIWRDPWMVVGSATFTGDLAARVGLRNVFADSAERYPHVTIDQIAARRADVLLLPDEPYAFTARDGPEAFANGQRWALVEGRALTWYGPSLATAYDTIRSAVRQAAASAIQG